MTTDLLHSLNREVADRQETEQERLLAQMDCLYESNMTLNHSLYHIVKEFKSEANLQMEKRYRQFLFARDQSFYTISSLIIFISLLTILLYIVIHRNLNRRKQYQRCLEASNKKSYELLKSRKRMMLTIAHDLRSPLAIIKESAELLPRFVIFSIL